MSKHKETTAMKIKETMPGLFLCIGIALLSKFLARFVPTLGAATLSIFIGILLGNTVARQNIFHKGTKFSEGTLLSISVVMLGATVSITKLLNLGFSGLIYILLQMAVTIAACIIIGNAMKFNTDFILLMAGGNSVCGSSAVASVAPVIHAHSRDKGIAITMVNVTGTVLMILLPLISSFIFNNETVRTSAFIGGILQSVGQVVASGSMVNEEVKDLATIYKIVRIIFLVGVVFALAAIKNKSPEEGLEAVEEEIHSHTHQSRIKVPWYIIGFFITCALYSLGLVPPILAYDIKEADNFVEIVALAGIGMRVSFKDLVKQGPKVSMYCLWIALSQIVSAAVLIFILL